MEWLNELAMTGATTLVSALATQTWESARDGLVKVFTGTSADTDKLAQRANRDRAALAELDPGQAQQRTDELAIEWRGRLRDVLEEHPGVQAELAAWAERVRAELQAPAISNVQNNKARDDATIFAVQHGSQKNRTG